jgi:hypothetical protein
MQTITGVPVNRLGATAFDVIAQPAINSIQVLYGNLFGVSRNVILDFLPTFRLENPIYGIESLLRVSKSLSRYEETAIAPASPLFFNSGWPPFFRFAMRPIAVFLHILPARKLPRALIIGK